MTAGASRFDSIPPGGVGTFFSPGADRTGMSEFDLDLRTVEEEIEDETEGDGSARVVLGVLDGTTDPGEWVDHVEAGDVLVLAVEGDVNERASGFAREVTEMDGDVVHFRGFLIVTPAGVTVDTDRL